MTQPCVCTTARKASRALTRYYEAAMEGSGVTIVQFSILRALSRTGRTTLTALADELVMDRTSLYRTIEPLKSVGAITITRVTKGPAKEADLTPEGRAIMERATPYWERAQARVLAQIGEETWSDLGAFLAGIPRLVDTPNG